MMSGAKKMVPKRRFKEFLNAGEWKERKLSELATMNARIGWQNLRTSEFLDSGDYLLITGTDFDNGRVKYSTCHYVEKKRFDQDTKIQLSTGSILITKDGTLGKVALVEELPKPATLNAGVFNVRVKDDTVLSYKYLYHYLKAPFLMKYVTANATGGTIKHLNQSILVDFPIPITEKPEQDRITKLLDSLESSITLHQRKLDKLQATKKALLQEMFPEEGQNKPKRRFKGFTDAWEQRKLGDIATITGGGTPSTNISEYWNGDIDWYSPVEIGENRYVSRSTRKITKLGLEKSSAKILPVGTVLFTSRAGIGNTAILQAEGCTNQGFQSITPNSKELDTYFLYTMTPKLKRYGEVTGAGSTFVEVSGKQMEQMNLMIPSLEEQKHVSQLFELMDDAITLHQRKLERLQEVKKGLLQKMFV